MRSMLGRSLHEAIFDECQARVCVGWRNVSTDDDDELWIYLYDDCNLHLFFAHWAIGDLCRTATM